MALIDSHCHLDFVDDLDSALDRARAKDIGKIITIGTSLECSKKCVNIAEKYSTDDLQTFATCGLHPKDAKEEFRNADLGKAIDELRKISKSSNKVVGIGETGLDYYERETGNNKHKTTDEEKEFQRKLFKVQANLAVDLNLPLIVHCRNGWSEIFKILSSNGQRLMASGVFHSFTGDWETAKKAFNLGFYISFSGIVTFENAKVIQGVAKKMPIDRMLIETDSPFLAPEPNRGSVNEPKNVKIIARFIADLRKSSLDTIEEATTKNAKKLFGI